VVAGIFIKLRQGVEQIKMVQQVHLARTHPIYMDMVVVEVEGGMVRAAMAGAAAGGGLLEMELTAPLLQTLVGFHL
jgi:hypothetical protein